MKNFLCFLLGVASLLPLRAEPQPVALSADADYKALEALNSEQAPANLSDAEFEKRLTWFDQHSLALKAGALAFYAANPSDPRRWDYVMTIIQYPPLFIRSFRPDVATKGAAAIIVDEGAAAEWGKQREALLEALLASTDAPLEMKELADWFAFVGRFHAVTAAKARGEPFDYSPLRAQFDAHVAKYPELDIIAARAANYLGALERELKVPEPRLEGWKHLLDAPNASLRNQAAGQLQLHELKTKPMKLAFTAADGRAVDLQGLRGKVVLIDFWATWCGPCKAEIPNVVANYKKYHDKGFEVIGIALEDGKLTPKDTAGQIATKLAKAKKVLTDFTTANDMPWPQYLDGKYWKTDIATQYAVQSIPAMFLLDQDGKVVSTDARGEALEVMVKKLLKL